jgi:hypothetical protein
MGNDFLIQLILKREMVFGTGEDIRGIGGEVR